MIKTNRVLPGTDLDGITNRAQARQPYSAGPNQRGPVQMDEGGPTVSPLPLAPVPPINATAYSPINGGGGIATVPKTPNPPQPSIRDRSPRLSRLSQLDY